MKGKFLPSLLFGLMYAYKNSEQLVNPVSDLLCGVSYGSAEYHPKRTKLKGWQKELRRCTFNKNR